jgi:Zn-dependent M28 family amino/carboxypeptidase
MSDIFRLADDSMRGRRIGTPENAKARDFLAARFDALGLETVSGQRIFKWAGAPRRGSGDSVRGANVLGMIKGTKSPGEYIVVTAHFDHIGVGRPVAGDSIFNGADDNGSGTVALLALAKHFMKAKPAHSILFALVDGEESGDLGSKALVAAPPVSLEQMLIDVNMDMVGRNINNELYAAGPSKYPQLRPLAEAAVACAPAPIILKLGHDSGGRGQDWTDQSDQGAFHAKGIPFVYFGEEDHPDYHRVGDSPDHLMPAFLISSARLVADFVRRFDEKPVARK